MSEFTSLAAAFAYHTECNLATLERLRSLKRSSKWERQRQQNICDSMVAACRDFRVAGGRTLPRLTKMLTCTSGATHGT
jgi:hypothetical protein